MAKKADENEGQAPFSCTESRDVPLQKAGQHLDGAEGVLEMVIGPLCHQLRTQSFHDEESFEAMEPHTAQVILGHGQKEPCVVDSAKMDYLLLGYWEMAAAFLN